jgi:pimeloyl-ACP methyl ester carboxylesterase
LSPRGFHRVAYREWGERDNPRVLVCVHGLTRNARDFDALAQQLSARYRVVCPDVVGRGDSAWLGDPGQYTYAQYLSDMTALLARLDIDEVDWLGTSMGGLIGMMLAAQPGTPIRRLVLNDTGPFIPQAALERLAAYVGTHPQFETFEEAEAHLRHVHAPFGALSDEQWRELTERSVTGSSDIGYSSRYDPEIGTALRQAPPGDVDLWAVWEQVQCPALVLRGEQSDLLLRETAAAMATRGPCATVVQVARCGHAPALLDAEQIAVIADWLDGDQPPRGRFGAVG